MASSVAIAAAAVAAPHNGIIDHPEKIGIGAAKPFQSLDPDVMNLIGVNWYYNWTPRRFTDYTDTQAEFIPNIWGGGNVNAVSFAALASSQASEVLGFNEPDNAGQSNLSVADAIALWPQIEAAADTLGMRIGSPATAGSPFDPWQINFMNQVWANGYRVDFMVVHWYNGLDGNVNSIEDFRVFLESVYLYFGLPIWVKEWGLVDFNDDGIYDADIEASFSLRQSASYFLEAAHMMDDLDYVERHSWFQLWPDGQYAGAEGWQMFPVDYSGNLTDVGHAFSHLTQSVGPNPNRLTNPGFEFGLNTNWNGFNTSIAAEDPLSGSTTLLAPSFGGVFHQPVRIPAGSYEISFDLREEDNAGPVFLGVEFGSQQGAQIVREFDPSSEWSRHSVVFEVASETPVTVWFWGGNGDQTGQYRVDDVSLRLPPLCEADIDGDRQLTSGDIVDFLDTTLADTSSGGTTLLDLISFLITFDEGCES